MLAICSICAILSRESLLTAINEEHSVIRQLKNCFNYGITLQQKENYVCVDCIRSLNDCDAFYAKIQRAQETLQILYKVKSKPGAKPVEILNSIKGMNASKETESECETTATQTVEACKENSWANANEEDTILIKNEAADDDLGINASSIFEMDSNEQSKISENSTTSLREVLIEQIKPEEDNAGENAEQMVLEESEFVEFNGNMNNENELGVVESTEQESSNDDIETDIDAQPKTDLKYKCEMCPKEFKSKILLTEHQKSYHNTDSMSFHVRLKTHGSVNSFQCKLCNEMHENYSSLRHHMQIHDIVEQFRCHICSKSFHSRFYLERHLARHKKAVLPVCDICGKVLSNKVKLNEHMNGHRKGLFFKCIDCPDMFATSQALNRHILSDHSGKFYTCKYCNKGFRSSCWYEAHMLTHSVLESSGTKY